MDIAATESERTLSGRILIVDDEPETLALCQSYLQKAGHEVRCASSGEEALCVIREFRPHVVVLDCMMPEMDGLTVTRRLRERREFDDTIVIMLTAFAALKDKVAGYQAGVNDYLTKPFMPEELLLRLDSFLATSERQQLALERSKLEILAQTATAVAHRVNNPLQTILTATEMLEDDAYAEERPDMVETIREKALSIAKLVSKLTRTNRVVSTAYVGDEKMLDIEASTVDEETRRGSSS